MFVGGVFQFVGRFSAYAPAPPVKPERRELLCARNSAFGELGRNSVVVGKKG